MIGSAAHTGRKPLSIEQHKLRSTYRCDRHGPAQRGSASTTPREVSPADRARLLRGLGEAGRTLARQALEDYQGWTIADLVALRRAAQTHDRLAAYGERIEADGGPIVVGNRGAVREHPLCAAQRAETRTLIGLLRVLRLESGEK